MAAVFSVFSVSWGIFGLLALWEVDLDPLSMAALLMAIGFSVDFTAHISYHYYKAPYGVSQYSFLTLLYFCYKKNFHFRVHAEECKLL